ncbi:metallophosphoesterase [Myxococcaceae bacterium GXIMD 01537]
MVRWLHPAQVIRTGIDAIISAVVGARADPRLVEAIVRPQEPFFDYSKDTDAEGGLWLDYVADTGDGWDSTYAVARLLALPELAADTPGNARYVTERGRILVLGGDAVYPSASRDNYEERLLGPYESAMQRSPEPSPDFFVIPGNHDWYDGLVAFMRLFCANRWIAGRRTRQSRSYFALKLPHGWWMLGTDVQLNSDIDVPQVDYFRKVAEQMGPEDRVILCNAEPAWIMATTSKRRRGYVENNLEYLEEQVLGKRISVFLAGDLHHYRRHEDAEGRHKITAGGGGAFLHPTHAPAAPELRDGYRLKTCFPTEDESRRLARKNLLLPLHSPSYGLVTGTLYLVLALAAYAEVGKLGLSQWREVLTVVANAMVNRPWTMVLGLGTIGGMVAVADVAFGRWRTLAGALHGLGHLLASFFLAWGVSYLTVSVMGLCPELDPENMRCTGGLPHLVGRFFSAATLLFAGGFAVGPLVTGLYLWLSVNRFGAHSNEAFGSLALPDWKNFLRLRIGADGVLTLYPVGLERVPRHWKESHVGPHAPRYEPDDPEATEPVYIEEPIRVRGRASATQETPAQRASGT